MEDFPLIGVENSAEPIEYPKKRRRVFGESGWLNDILRRAKNPETDSKEDTDDDTETVFSKGSSGILKRLFRSFVSKEPIEAEPRPDESIDDEEEGRILHVSHEETELSTQIDRGVEEPETPEQADMSYPEAQLDQPTEAEQIVDSPVREVATNEEITENPDLEFRTSRVEEQTLENIPEAFDNYNRASIESATDAPIQERIIERPSPVGGLLALEYLGRKRADRKIKKNAAQLKKRVGKTEKSNKQLEEITRRSQEQINLLQERRGQYETVNPATRRESEVAPKRPESPKLTKFETYNSRQERPSVKLETPRNETQEIHYTNPERVLEEVTAAADKDAAIEKIYERRQEIKDDEGRFNDGQAASVASVLQTIDMRTAHSVKERQALARAAKQAHDGYARSEKNIYKQAVVSGFATALVIIAAALAYLWTR